MMILDVFEPRGAALPGFTPANHQPPHTHPPTPRPPTPHRTTKSTASISLLQPLYKNQNYMIPQKALQLDKTAGATRTTTTTTTTTRNALAELTRLAVPTRKDELAALKSDLLKIIDVCQRKLAVCDDKLR